MNTTDLGIPVSLTISNGTPTKSPILYTPKYAKLDAESLARIEKVKSEAANRLAEEKKAKQEEEDRKMAEEQAKKIQKEKEEKEAREKARKAQQARKDEYANRRGTIWSFVAEGLQAVYCTLRHSDCGGRGV
jgi:type IV secretory pathway VirB10-like protein